MIRKIFTLLFLTFSGLSSAQSANQCSCSALIDPDFNSKILLYSKPGRELIRVFQNDSAKEDFLTLTIDRDSAGFFRVTIQNEESPAQKKKGWIKKTKTIGTYTRNYEQNDTLFLYSKPDMRSKIQSSIPEWVNSMFTIKRCSKRWVYVSIVYKGKIREGWLRPEKQCANPYTTCN